MARTKDVVLTPEQQEKMTQEVMASLQPSTYGKSYQKNQSSANTEDVENADLKTIVEDVAVTTPDTEDEPASEALLTPNPQKRISGKQRKATLEEYQ